MKCAARADKAALRHRFTAIRDPIHAANPNPLGAQSPAPQSLAGSMVHSAVSLAGPVQTAALFWPLRSEIDPRPLMPLLEAEACKLALPWVVAPAKPLGFRYYQTGAALVPDRLGLLTAEPGTEPGAEPAIPELLFIPLLAFDAQGYRLGYGGGFYDRTLAQLKSEVAPGKRIMAIGLAYEAQYSETSLAFEVSDMPLDAVFTEQAQWRRPAQGSGRLNRYPWF